MKLDNWNINGNAGFARLVGGVVLILTLSSCASTQGPQVRVLDGEMESAPEVFFGLPLSSGQIIVSESGGPLSFFFSLFTEEFYPFVHAGIIVIEDGEPFVVEAAGTYLPGVGATPTLSIIGGGVLKTPLEQLVRRQRYVEIYEPPTMVDREKMVEFALATHKAKTPFDPYFNNQEHEALYCTEFIALALVAGGHDPIKPVLNRKNESLGVMLKWLNITSTETILAGSFIEPDRYVGTLGTFPSRRKMRLFNELKRELHARFTPDQKLGNIFRVENKNLRFREPVYRFLNEGLNLFDFVAEEPDLDTMRQAIKVLADEMLGEVPQLALQSLVGPGQGQGRMAEVRLERNFK
ncbi:YiiX/YebB-like N1pC/P60 family cysteine hydrolase [Pseudomonadota bacterium]